MRSAVAVLVLGTGCSQLFGLDTPAHQDASPSDGDAPLPLDAAADASYGTCVTKWLGAPLFTPPMSLSFNGAADDIQPTVTTDGLEILFGRVGEVYQGTRTSTGLPFSGINRVGSLSSAAGEGKTWQASNRLLVFQASARNGGSGGSDLWRGTRATTSMAFDVDQIGLENLNTNMAETDPHMLPDQLHIYFVRAGGIMYATRMTTNESFATATALPELVGASGVEQSPSVTADQRVIVFASNRDGNFDLYYATRTNTMGPFGTPKLLAISTSGSADHSPHISEDGCTLYFASDRDAAGNLDIFTTSVQ